MSNKYNMYLSNSVKVNLKVHDQAQIYASSSNPQSNPKHIDDPNQMKSYVSRIFNKSYKKIKQMTLKHIK